MRLRGLRWRGELPLCLLLGTGLYQAGRRRGEQASLDHSDFAWREHIDPFRPRQVAVRFRAAPGG